MSFSDGSVFAAGGRLSTWTPPGRLDKPFAFFFFFFLDLFHIFFFFFFAIFHVYYYFYFLKLSRIARNSLAIKEKLSYEKTTLSKKYYFFRSSVPRMPVLLSLIKSIAGDAALRALLF